MGRLGGKTMSRFSRAGLGFSLVLLAALVAAPAWASHPRPMGAGATRVALVPALERCTAPNATHGPPLQRRSCYPPHQTSDFLTVGTVDANGQLPQSNGYVRLQVFYCPMCASPINEDLFIKVQMTDVRQLSDLGDYAGELETKLHLRLTDHYNSVIGAPPPECSGNYTCAATVEDTDFPFAVACTPTEDKSIGSTCAVDTRANAIMPGIIRMNARATWELGQVEVFDGGADGKADTPDNTLFAVQGVFLP
jgi:hypothetical protein